MWKKQNKTKQNRPAMQALGVPACRLSAKGISRNLNKIKALSSRSLGCKGWKWNSRQLQNPMIFYVNHTSIKKTKHLMMMKLKWQVQGGLGPEHSWLWWAGVGAERRRGRTLELGFEGWVEIQQVAHVESGEKHGWQTVPGTGDRMGQGSEAWKSKSLPENREGWRPGARDQEERKAGARW